MPIPYQHKRSTAAGVEPTTLQDGEIAINVAAADPKIFFKDSANTVRAFSLASYASATHSHVVADVTDFTTKANVVSVNGITGVVSISHTSVSAAAASHTHDAADVVSGTLNVARIPTIGYTALSGVPTTFAPSAHTHVAADVTNLTSVANVVSVNGVTGSVVLTNASVSAASASHTHAAADITDFAAEAAKYGPVTSVNSLTGTIVLTSLGVSAASAVHSHVAADITNLTSVANVVSVNAKTGVVSISHTDVTAASASHTHAASDVTSGTFDAARLPLATTIAAGAVIVGTGLGVSSGTVSVSYGTTSGTACQGNDARLSDTRTPTDGSVTTAKLANDAVTYSKIQNVSATDRLLGRSSAGSGDVEEITCGSFGRSLIGSADAAAARTTLSVQPTASPAFTGAATFTVSSGSSVPVTVANSGTGNSLVVATNFIVDGSGKLGLFGAPRAFEACAVLGTAPSSSQASLGFRVQCTYPSSTTTDAASFSSFPTTQAASYTLTNLYHFGAFQQGFGAGSTVTNQYGLYVDSTLTGATNNYAVYTGIASGTGRWAIYAAGTAASYFGGQVQISAGSGSSGSYKPGVAVSGDDDTGLQQVGGANTISLVTAGSERVRVGSGGGVGIGTATTTDALNVVGITSHYQSANGTPALGSKQYYSACFENFSAGYGLALGGVQGGNGAAYLQVQSFSSAVAYPMYLQALGGEVLIGTTTDNGAYLLQVNSQIYATNATIATSDARFKTNVESLNDATAVIEALRPVAFDFIPHAERNFAAERQVGLIAQEAQSALAGTDYANSVVAQCGDHLGLAYEKLVPVLIKALQESNARIAVLEERLNHA